MYRLFRTLHRSAAVFDQGFDIEIAIEDVLHDLDSGWFDARRPHRES